MPKRSIRSFPAITGGSSRPPVTVSWPVFASVIDALRCAVEVQQAIAERNTGVAADNRIELRIGINVGDVFGEGVNIAARLEGLAEPGGICVSARAQEDAAGRLDVAFEDMAERANLSGLPEPGASRVVPSGLRLAAGEIT